MTHRKALFDTDLRKGTRETPIKSTQLGQSTMGKQSWSSPWPATRRRWREAMIKGRPTPRGTRLHAGAAQPLLQQAVACFHAMAVGAGPHAKNSLLHRLGSCINRGVPPSHSHTSLEQYLTLSSSLYLLVVVVEQGKATLESLAPWKKRPLGMNRDMSSSKVMLSYAIIVILMN